MTCEDVVEELQEVVKKKLKYLKERTFEIALSETKRALSDSAIIPRSKYSQKREKAKALIPHKKDVPILAAVLSVKPDYFLTGDSHFLQIKLRVLLGL